MHLRHLTGLSLCALTTFAACAGQPEVPEGQRISIAVAPLNLPGVQGVQFALSVFNAPPVGPMFDVDGNAVGAANLGALVWNKPSVTSNQYGNAAGGDIAYVGTCDASQPQNWVALSLRQVDVGPGNGSYAGSGPFAGSRVLDDENSAFTNAPGSGDGDPDFDNPCDFAAPCVLKARCAENEDTAVEFNLTVMRDAEQGFFDVAVDFEDVFCSVKVDTCYDGDEPIELLFDDAGNRVETAVIAAACSAGVGDSDTVIWLGSLNVTCDDGVSFTIDPTGDDDGNPVTPGLQGNHETDASAAGTLVTDGAKATGTLTFSLATAPPPGVNIPLQVGTLASRSDTGLDYVSDAATLLDSATLSASVAATSVGQGIGYNDATTFGSISVAGSDGVIYSVTVSGSGFAGGVDPVYDGAVNTTVGYGLYWGQEDLECGTPGQSCNKAYWNVALNIDDLRDAGFENCRVTMAITASGSPAVDQFVNGTLPGPGQTYGFVQIDAELTDGTTPTCFQGPMGSTYAATEYGASSDMIGADPFPALCYYYERGDAAPRSLGDIDGYFRDNDASPDEATYAGRIPTNPAADRLALAFPQMGGDSTGLCRSRVLNMNSAVWFDGAGALQEFTWRGTGGTGLYRIDVYLKGASGRWIAWGGYQVDLRTADGRAFFAAGGTFPSSGDEAVAMVLTRLDTPVPVADNITLTVGPPAP